MNILIIGNGFDIAHGLPTTYKDFLKFIEQINRITDFHGTVNDFQSRIEQTGYDKFNELHKGVAQYIDTAIRDDANLRARVEDTYQKRPNQIIDKIIELSKDNIWISWFNKSEMLLKEGWIDFESEISRVVQHFENISKEVTQRQVNIQTLSEENRKMIKHFAKNKVSNDLTEVYLNDYKIKMLKDLNGLIRCFELYLEDCVRNIDNSLLSPDIYNLNVDKVLSFNYTDTYNRLYSCKNRNIEYDYIHGKSKLENNPTNNMVLGIDEYLQGNERNTNIDYIEFKKYYQRVHKRTGCAYKKWLEQIDKSENEEHHVYIFGHSLAVTDKEVLKEILTNSNVKTTIFYYNNKSYGEQLAHLVQVLKQEVLISMVYGSNPKIKFELQKMMIDKNNSEWQILNDRNALWNLYKFSDKEIQVIIKRINEMIKNNDLEYFHDQRNVISLYDALVNNYSSINGSKLIKIAESLYNAKTFVWHDSEDWNDANYRGVFPCDSRVCKFIDEINKYNLHQKDKIRSEFDINNLNILYQQISESAICEEKVFELFDCLFSMFVKGENNVESIWICIFALSGKISSDRWRTFIKERTSGSQGIGKIRLRYIQDAIDEQDYYEHMHQNMEDQADAFSEYSC